MIEFLLGYGLANINLDKKEVDYYPIGHAFPPEIKDSLEFIYQNSKD